jgi:alpha-amylase/alpha-mannosidase (GH57 family)
VVGRNSCGYRNIEVLAENNIRFTILAPRQAKAVRKIGSTDWTEVNDRTVNTTKAYTCNLPSGKSIVLYFYEGDISQGIAFNGLLNDGKRFADRLLSVIDESDDEPQLVHVATDGETYGHHHKHGEMALAYCLDYIEKGNHARLTNYAQFLELCPPQDEAQIIENSSWSCVHGVERWRSNCGCNSGKPGYHQLWRQPLKRIVRLVTR